MAPSPPKWSGRPIFANVPSAWPKPSLPTLSLSRSRRARSSLLDAPMRMALQGTFVFHTTPSGPALVTTQCRANALTRRCRRLGFVHGQRSHSRSHLYSRRTARRGGSTWQARVPNNADPTLVRHVFVPISCHSACFVSAPCSVGPGLRFMRAIAIPCRHGKASLHLRRPTEPPKVSGKCRRRVRGQGADPVKR